MFAYLANFCLNFFRIWRWRANFSFCFGASVKEKLFEILFINDKHSFAMAKVHPDIRTLLRNAGNRLFIDLTSCVVSDRLYLVQCYTCQEFGHKTGSTQCKSAQNPVCLYCSGPHQSKNCGVKNEREKHKCSNCAKSSNSAIKAKACGHTSTSFLCPFVQNEARSLMSKTMSMDANSKNIDLRKVIVM